MCQSGCVHENSITGDCTIKGPMCPVANENRIEEIKEEIDTLEAHIAALQEELDELEG